VLLDEKNRSLPSVRPVYVSDIWAKLEVNQGVRPQIKTLAHVAETTPVIRAFPLLAPPRTVISCTQVAGASTSAKWR